MTSDTVYLCHKCNGTLSACADKRAYSCGCMSGYVRDWQTPVPLETVLPLQAQAAKKRVDLYAAQGRDEEDGLVTRAKVLLARLQA